ncbi:unnamed protein product, partial [Acanthocheilonema viteae]
MWWWLEYFERWRVDIAYRLLRCVYSHKDFEHHWYPQILIMQIDENPEWLVNCQKLIAVAEWIKDGAASNIVAGHTNDPDTGEYLGLVETAVTQLIGESCLNAHHLVVSYQNLSELNETASAVIQCSGLGILKPNTIISTLDFWWVVEGDDLLLSFIYVICRNYRWTFTKLRIFAVIKETEVEAVKEQVLKRIHKASLEADSIEYLLVPPDDIAAYESAKLSTLNQNMQQEQRSKSRRIYKNEPPLRLNSLIRKESINADLIMLNLPRPR